ncbi:hypothetical protein C8R45DRAFT_1164978 [Mycena sanguinolenta]|nr:hypothetical protein C8R45DRAFT_1164978 [Mycena sanguinolenta]
MIHCGAALSANGTKDDKNEQTLSVYALSKHDTVDQELRRWRFRSGVAWPCSLEPITIEILARQEGHTTPRYQRIHCATERKSSAVSIESMHEESGWDHCQRIIERRAAENRGKASKPPYGVSDRFRSSDPELFRGCSGGEEGTATGNAIECNEVQHNAPQCMVQKVNAISCNWLSRHGATVLWLFTIQKERTESGRAVVHAILIVALETHLPKKAVTLCKVEKGMRAVIVAYSLVKKTVGRWPQYGRDTGTYASKEVTGLHWIAARAYHDNTASEECTFRIWDRGCIGKTYWEGLRLGGMAGGEHCMSWWWGEPRGVTLARAVTTAR